MAGETDDLTEAADDVVTALQWQLDQLRSTHLSGDGLAARRKVAAARRRVFTLVSGVKDADLTVVGRMIQLASGTTQPDDPPSSDLDAALRDAITAWRAMDPPEYWAAVTHYVATTKAAIAEQVLLLTYLSVVVGGAQAPADEQPSSVELLAGVSTAWTADDPTVVYGGCASLSHGGADARLAFSTRVALLVLAAITLPDS